MLRSLFIKFIKFYRYFLSPLKPQACRYYPTCSQYAMTQFQYNNFFKALFFTITRILRCNQLFIGGFDYPLVKVKKRSNIFTNTQKNIQKIKTLFVPKDNQFYYIVKIIFEIKEKNV